MNSPRYADLGDTWRNYAGTRLGFRQVRTTTGTVEPIRTRTAVWSRDGSPVVAELGEYGEAEWTIRGKINTAEPSNSVKWAILVAKTAFERASKEAISERDYFSARIRKADDFYGGMFKQNKLDTAKTIPQILAHAKGQIGHRAPNASKWLTERARRYAVKFEGYKSPSATEPEPGAQPARYEPPAEPSSASLLPELPSISGDGAILRKLLIGGVIALVSIPVLNLVTRPR